MMLLQSLVLPQSRLEIASACVFGLLTAVNYGSESGGTSAEYSKFAIETTKTDTHRVSGRVGMLVIYVPALFLVGALIMAGTASLVNIMLAVHFGKRTLETLFVHRYSGSMPLSTASTIGVYYSLVSAAIASLPSVTRARVYPEATTAGIALFAVGQMGNLYHHWLLARLRDKDTKQPSKDDRKRAYKIPEGGLFPLVAMPHYFFELVAWLGVATASQHLNAFLVFTSMCSYLAGRAQATSRWNVANIPGYPAERRSLVPGIF